MATHRQVGSTLAALLLLLGSAQIRAQTEGAGPATGAPASEGSTGDASSSAAAPHDLRFLPGVRFSQSYSSNALRRPSGEEEDGFTTEVTPYLLASVNRARLQGDARLAIRNFYRTETREGIDSFDTLRYALNGAFNYLTPGDRLGLRGSAIIRDVNLSPFSASAEDPSLVPTNRRRFSNLTLTPYFSGRLGNVADYRAEYMARTTQVSGGGRLVDRLDQRISGNVQNGPQLHGWGWSVSGSRQHRDFGNGFTLGRSQATAALYYLVSPEMRVGVTANYAAIDRLTGSNGKASGWGPGLDLDWNPTSRTGVSLTWADQYYGSNARMKVSHRAQRWTFGFNYLRAMLSSSDASVLFFNPGAIFSDAGFPGAVNPVYQALLDQQLLEGGDEVLDVGLVSDAVVYTKRATASIGYAIPRGSLIFTLHRSSRERAVENIVADTSLGALTGDVSQRGMSLGMRVNLGQRTSLRLLGRVRESESSTTGAEARLTTLQAGYHARLTADTSAGIGVRRTVQRGSGGASGYEDNTVFGTLDVRF
jgi:uncharacterized protein (PEP-CTERM system associated)